MHACGLSVQSLLAVHARLDLARTRIGDAGLRSLGKLPRLVQLNLRGTQVTDAGIARLEAHPELRSLVLHGTVVSDASVEILGSFPRLTDLYVWQTRISPGGVERIRSARPGINVREAPVFPESRPEGRDGRRRRRN